MKEENKINAGGFSLNADSVGVDNQVKINFTFKAPVTDSMLDALEGADNAIKAERKLNSLLGPRLEETGRSDNAAFQGRFHVTALNGSIEGMYDSDSMVRSSVEGALLEILRDGLKQLSGDEKVSADINLACSF